MLDSRYCNNVFESALLKNIVVLLRSKKLNNFNIVFPFQNAIGVTINSAFLSESNSLLLNERLRGLKGTEIKIYLIGLFEHAN